MAALSFLSHRSNTESRPTLFLIDLDPDCHNPSHASSAQPSQNGGPGGARHRRQRGGRYGAARTKSTEHELNGTYLHTNTKTTRQQQQQQHHQGSGMSPSSSVPSSPSYSPTRSQVSSSRHGASPSEMLNQADDASDDDGQGRGFLTTVLRKIAGGALTNMVPIALVSSHTSQDSILDIFNMGVADVLIKPVAAETARTLFLSFHRYSLYKAATTIPRYASQKSSLALPSHARLRNVFLKDQWLSDILINHYCPPQAAQGKINISDFPSMGTPAAVERVKHLRKRLLSWDFHPHDLCQEDLMRCVIIVFQEVMKLDGLGDLNIPEHLLHRFVIGLRDSYHRSNPYHNFAHAVDVLQATFYFLCRMGMLPKSGRGFPPILEAEPLASDEEERGKNISNEISSGISSSSSNSSNSSDTATTTTKKELKVRVHDYMRAEDIFALVVASIGHDVGHPGVNNMFLVNAHTPLAQVYNDRSVLESFHSMALFQVMKKHGFECFDVDSQNRKFMEFRKMVVSTILATDMGLHFDYVGKIKEQASRVRARNDDPQAVGQNKMPATNIVEQERLVLCGTLIKCADISNASRPFHVAERWSTVLLQEMCNQADIEKEMAICSGQPVAPGSTKSLANDRGMQIDSQLGFIHGFAMPLFASVAELIPEMEYCVDLLKKNHKVWEDRKAEYLKNGGPALTLVQHKTEVSKPLGKSTSNTNANANTMTTTTTTTVTSTTTSATSTAATITTTTASSYSHGSKLPQALHHPNHHHPSYTHQDRQPPSRRDQHQHHHQNHQPRPQRANGKMRTLTGGYESVSSRGGGGGGHNNNHHHRATSPMMLDREQQQQQQQQQSLDSVARWGGGGGGGGGSLPNSGGGKSNAQYEKQQARQQQARAAAAAAAAAADHQHHNQNHHPHLSSGGQGRTRAATSSGGRILHKTVSSKAL
ncbi:3',5'-cyclic-nucleotide phosphodiesterase [Actinomortierella ambigua]|nr:3',5'-cyclic-nucleotide phosphodiesterase [Actinomortierella ambigua]